MCAFNLYYTNRSNNLVLRGGLGATQQGYGCLFHGEVRIPYVRFWIKVVKNTEPVGIIWVGLSITFTRRPFVDPKSGLLALTKRIRGHREALRDETEASPFSFFF